MKRFALALILSLFIDASLNAVTSTYGSSIDAISNYSYAAERDREIMQQIRYKLDTAYNAQYYTNVNVNVSYGVISLTGYIDSEWQRNDLKAQIRSVPGVKEINDQYLIVGNRYLTQYPYYIQPNPYYNQPVQPYNQPYQYYRQPYPYPYGQPYNQPYQYYNQPYQYYNQPYPYYNQTMPYYNPNYPYNQYYPTNQPHYP